MAYADFDYYQNTYMGSAISEEYFPILATRASDYLDYITMGKAELETDNMKVKKACCALAEAYQIIDKADSQALSSHNEKSSETVGGFTVHYRNPLEYAAIAKADLYNIVLKYLAGSGLLHRGGKGRDFKCMRHIL